MRYNQLGRTDIKVSALCLGSMTWGSQNTAPEAYAQIDMALDRGVNFIDTAEMYPVNPLTKETQGDTERILGDWIGASGRRQDIILATKVSGKGYMNVRDGAPITPASIDLRLMPRFVPLKPITLIFINYIGPTVGLICLDRTGPMMPAVKIVTR